MGRSGMEGVTRAGTHVTFGVTKLVHSVIVPIFVQCRGRNYVDVKIRQPGCSAQHYSDESISQLRSEICGRVGKSTSGLMAVEFMGTDNGVRIHGDSHG